MRLATADLAAEEPGASGTLLPLGSHEALQELIPLLR